MEPFIRTMLVLNNWARSTVEHRRIDCIHPHRQAFTAVHFVTKPEKRIVGNRLEALFKWLR